MNQELLIQQTIVEGQALEHITRALEVTLGWTIQGDVFARKLSSVRYFTELYQRHLERLFALEEIDGYMESVSRLSPELSNQVDDLRREHEQFRAAVRASLVRIDLASPGRLADFESICGQLQTTINQVREHLRRESDLLVDSINRDTGGQG
jgi:hypothetical protein